MRDMFAEILLEHASGLSSKYLSLLTPIAKQADPHNHEVLKPLAAYCFVTQSPSRGMLRALIKLLFGFPKPDLTAITLIRALLSRKKSAITTDAILQYIHQQQSALHPSAINALKSTDVGLFLQHVDASRLLKLLWCSDLGCLRDTVNMMRTIQENMPALSYFPAKPKNILQLHTCCVRMMPKIGQKDFELQQREDILILDRRAINDELFIRVPKTHFDLIDLGEELSFCVGNGDYSRLVQQKRCSIVAICDKNGPKLGIQFNRYRLLQAQGFANQEETAPSPDLLKQIMDVLIAEPSLVKDFLPITDSHWVHGYRYTDDDLYLLLNNWIYLYRDVPQDVYECLLDSDTKGRYVNRYIKPVYACERIGHIDELCNTVADAA